jgi:hypothetical protein
MRMSPLGVRLSVLLNLLYFHVVVVAAVVKVAAHVGSKYGINGHQKLVGKKRANVSVLA